MATPGKVVLREGGKRGVATSGKAAVFNADSDCPDCCECKPRVLATKFTHPGDPHFILTAFQGDGIGPPGAFWRLIEVTYCTPYKWGCIDANGKLVNLPGVFGDGVSYSGHVELQIGCLGTDGNVHFPGVCVPIMSRGNFPC